MERRKQEELDEAIFDELDSTLEERVCGD